MKIVILDDYQDAARGLAAFSRLAGHDVTVYRDTVKDADAIAGRLADAEAVVLIRERTRLPAAIIERLPKLRIISQTGRPGGHIDMEACTKKGIAVCETKGSPVAPAELTWGLLLAAVRHIALEDRRMRAGQWQTTLGRSLKGRTLGIYGFGNIGSIVAGYGKAFGMNVIVWGRENSARRAAEAGFPMAASREALFEQSDALSLHVRLAPGTRGIVKAEDLARMKPDAVLVNVSRAELIVQDALENALRAGRPGFAAVDVYDPEPVLGAKHPLLSMDNVVCTPHLGYVEERTYETYFGAAFDNILAFAAGKPANVVNGEALKPRP